MELQVYMEKYSGFTKIARLLFIAKHSHELQKEALNMAKELILQSRNVQQYSFMFDTFKDSLNGELFDVEWMKNAEAENNQQLRKLEHELELARSNVIKEKIRMSLNDIGDFHSALGQYTPALKAYTRTRDYCTNTAHQITSNLNVIEASIGAGNYANVGLYISRASSILGTKSDDKVTLAKLAAANGLQLMNDDKFKSAAEAFISVGMELGNTFNHILTCEDVAFYGGVCALASFSRMELKDRVLHHPTFRTFLEATPLVRDLINDFLASKYDQLSETLKKVEQQAKLDIFLEPKFPDIMSEIRIRALVQYISPYSSVDLAQMAQAFGVEMMQLQNELADLIIRGLIQGRIDMESQYLLVQPREFRDHLYKETIKLGKDFIYEAKTSLLLAQINSKGIVHKDRPLARAAFASADKNRPRSPPSQGFEDESDDDAAMELDISGPESVFAGEHS